MKTMRTSGLKKLGKLKLAKPPGSSSSHRFKMGRGMNRKSLGQVPKRHQTGVEPVQMSRGFADFVRQMDVSNKLVDVAKKASSGVWRISKPQVIEVAKKYKFNIPNKEKPMKHLGSTGIQMIRYKPGVYYLYKPRRKTRKKRIRSATGKAMSHFNMGMGK